jgi:hypothetical protein
VLHVGAPKTASTYIQRRLRANAAGLRKRGIYVPVLPAVAEMAGNAKLLPTALGQRPSLTFQRAFPNIDVRELDPKKILAELLADWRRDAESVILSAENLRPQHASGLRALLPHDVPCVVVLFVRRQDRWVDSYFNQMIKTNEIQENMSAFLARLLEGGDERLCRPDWFEHYQAWRNAFGDCEIVFYDEVSSNVFGAFLNAAGFQSPPDLVDIGPAQLSLNVYELGYLLAFRRSIEYAEFLRRRTAAEKASRRLGLSQTRSVLNDADLRLLRNRLEESNRRLLDALNRSRDAWLLQLDATSESEQYCDLASLYQSDEYRRFQNLTDAVYNRRKLRDRFRELLGREK